MTRPHNRPSWEPSAWLAKAVCPHCKRCGHLTGRRAASRSPSRRPASTCTQHPRASASSQQPWTRSPPGTSWAALRNGAPESPCKLPPHHAIHVFGIRVQMGPSQSRVYPATQSKRTARHRHQQDTRPRARGIGTHRHMHPLQQEAPVRLVHQGTRHLARGEDEAVGRVGCASQEARPLV